MQDNTAWQDKKETIKGNIGERIVEKRLEANGYRSYSPTKDGPHPIDRLYIHSTTFETFMVDIKCKELRKKYPDTGFPLKHYQKYMAINKNIKVKIYFVDYIKGEIYGGELDKLATMDQNYPFIQWAEGIVYFRYSDMQVLDKLTESEIEEIRALKNT